MAKKPSYAAHMSQKKYKTWHSFWRWMPKKTWDARTKSHPIQEPKDAAAFLMVGALDMTNIHTIDTDEQPSSRALNDRYDLTYNDGRSIQPFASLVQYEPDLAVPGMELALCNHFNLEAHGVRTLHRLAIAMDYDRHAKWTSRTVEKLLKEAARLEFDPAVEDTRDSLELSVADCAIRASYAYTHRKPDALRVPQRTLELTKKWLDAKGSKNVFINSLFVDTLEKWGTTDDINRYKDSIKKDVKLIGSARPLAEYKREQEAVKNAYPRLLAS